jgi:hypothetical protein
LMNCMARLAAGDVEQMDPVPEFVFINCCYSGQDGTEATVLGQRNYPLLAASLAMQFIKMGAKAVVAAGWQVDDTDGLAFARQLYASLLQGETFGEAVRAAREAILPAAGQTGSNTWGAYQCYGEPMWRLTNARRPQSYSDKHGSGRLRRARDCLSAQELADCILQVVAVAGDKPRDALLLQLDSLLEDLQRDPLRGKWLRRSQVRAAIGEAYRELADHQRAVQWLQLGMRNAYSRVQLRHIELMVNSLSRLPDEDSQQLAQTILEKMKAIDDPALKRNPPEGQLDLNDTAASERACLLGSCHLRLALEPQPDEKRLAKLMEAATCFADGYGMKVKAADREDRRAYALANALLCAALATLLGAPKPKATQSLAKACGGSGSAMAKAASWQQHTLDLLNEMQAADMATSFWHYTNQFEVLVASNLLRAARGEATVAAELEQALRRFERAMVRWPAPSETESIRLRFETIDLVCGSARVARLAPAKKAEVGKVQTLACTVLKRLKELDKRGG